ncbi:MAG: PaaI family thioesterase [Pseudomonadota bacterium]
MSKRRHAQSLDDLPTPEVLRSMSGLEWLQKSMTGEVAAAPISALMGFDLVEVSSGRVVFRGTPEFEAANPMGVTHGGWYGAILDSAMALAIQSKVPPGKASTTLEFKINIIRPIRPGIPADAVGIAAHVGRTTGVASAELRGVDDGKLYATGSTTCQVFDVPDT